MRRYIPILLFILSIGASWAPQALAGSSWDGSWTGAWGGQSETEVKVSGNTVQYFFKGNPSYVGDVQVSPDMLSFKVGYDAIVTLQKTGPTTAIASFRNGSAFSRAMLTRSAARTQARAEGWDGTWMGFTEDPKSGFKIVISGNQAVSYAFGRGTSEVVRSTPTPNAFMMTIQSYKGQAEVTLHRNGTHSALFEFTVPVAGIRVTGRATRQ